MYVNLGSAKQLQKDTTFKIDYRNFFYGKKRIGIGILIISTFFVYKFITLLLNVAALYNSKLVCEYLKYSTDTPNCILLHFRYENKKSPLKFKISNLKFMINNNIVIHSDNIDINEEDELLFKMKFIIDQFQISQFDWKNFPIIIEAKIIAILFYYIPFTFIINYQNHIEILSKAKTQYDFYENIGLKCTKGTTNRHLICYIDAQKFLNSIFTEETKIDIKIDNVDFFFKPLIFEKINLQQFNYNSEIKKNEHIVINVFIPQDNDVFGHFFINTIKRKERLIVSHIIFKDILIPINFDPSYQVKSSTIFLTKEPFITLSNIQLGTTLCFSITFGKDSFLDGIYLYIFYLLQTSTVQFSGSQDAQIFVIGKITFEMSKINIELEILNPTVIGRLLLYSEPRAAFEITNCEEHPILALFKDIKFISNLTYYHEFYFRNRVAQVLETQIEFSSEFLLDHIIQEITSDEELKNPTIITIKTNINLLPASTIDKQCLSEVVIINIDKRISFNITSNNINEGTITILPNVIYFEIKQDSISNKLYGELSIEFMLKLNIKALDLIVDNNMGFLDTLLGMHVQFELPNKTIIEFNDLFINSENMPYTTTIDISNYNDRSLWFNTETSQESSLNIILNHFTNTLKNITSEMQFEFEIKTDNRIHNGFDNFCSTLFPHTDYKCRILQTFYIIKQSIPYSAYLKNTIIDMSVLEIKTNEACLCVDYVDNYFFITIPTPIKYSIQFKHINSIGSSLSFIPSNRKIRLAAILLNVLLATLLKDSTTVYTKTIRFWNNYGARIDIYTPEIQKLIFRIALDIPQELIDSRTIISFYNFIPLQLAINSETTGHNLIIINITSIQDDLKTYSIILQMEINLKDELMDPLLKFKFIVDSVVCKKIVSKDSFKLTDMFKFAKILISTDYTTFVSTLTVEKLKLIIYDLTINQHAFTDISVFSPINIKDISLQFKYYIDLTPIINNISTIILNLLGSNIVPSTFYLKYNMHFPASLLRYSYNQSFFFKISGLKANGNFNCNLVYNKKFYELSNTTSNDYYNMYGNVHTAVLLSQSQQIIKSVYFAGKLINDCYGDKMCYATQKHLIEYIDINKLQLKNCDGIFYKNPYFKYNNQQVYTYVDKTQFLNNFNINIIFKSPDDKNFAFDFSQVKLIGGLLPKLNNIVNSMWKNTHSIAMPFFPLFSNTLYKLTGICLRCPIDIILESPSNYISIVIKTGAGLWGFIDIQDALNNYDICIDGYNCFIPVLIGNTIIPESHQICTYLDNQFKNKAMIFCNISGQLFCFDLNRVIDLRIYGISMSMATNWIISKQKLISVFDIILKTYTHLFPSFSYPQTIMEHNTRYLQSIMDSFQSHHQTTNSIYKFLNMCIYFNRMECNYGSQIINNFISMLKKIKAVYK